MSILYKRILSKLKGITHSVPASLMEFKSNRSTIAGTTFKQITPITRKRALRSSQRDRFYIVTQKVGFPHLKRKKYLSESICHKLSKARKTRQENQKARLLRPRCFQFWIVLVQLQSRWSVPPSVFYFAFPGGKYNTQIIYTECGFASSHYTLLSALLDSTSVTCCGVSCPGVFTSSKEGRSLSSACS